MSERPVGYLAHIKKRLSMMYHSGVPFGVLWSFVEDQLKQSYVNGRHSVELETTPPPPPTPAPPPEPEDDDIPF